jgi:hypothetical protein
MGRFCVNLRRLLLFYSLRLIACGPYVPVLYAISDQPVKSFHSGCSGLSASKPVPRSPALQARTPSGGVSPTGASIVVGTTVDSIFFRRC